ncbi:MAG: tetratricopeptide repeat protein [Crocinitomicaceae bacterium]|nr:tetratricopeptide repeat protein [Crocinitomicaceae bacterium]
MFANPTHEAAHELLKDGKVLEAIETFSKALEINPDHPDIYSDRGVAHLHNMDKHNCFADLNKAIELQPEYSFRYAAMAFARNNFGDFEGAIVDYEKAVKLDPDDAVAQNNLGLLLEQQGYKKDAEKRFARADKLSEQEDHLLEVIDDLDQQKIDAKQEVEAAKETSNEPSTKETEDGSNSEEFKKIFTKKSQFKEFIRFVKNGFKIK